MYSLTYAVVKVTVNNRVKRMYKNMTSPIVPMLKTMIRFLRDGCDVYRLFTSEIMLYSIS
jgi:hypothetical protein